MMMMMKMIMMMMRRGNKYKGWWRGHRFKLSDAQGHSCL